MINLISSGDLDYGRVKRYVCDSKDDFAELPLKIAEGSTVQILSTGEIYQIDAEGKWFLAYTIGGSGHTPEKGVDYWTEDDKKEIIEDLIEAKPVKPVYDAATGNVFCNGVGVIITDSGNSNIITYELDWDTRESIEVPYEVKVLGGGDGSKLPCSYSGSSIVMNGGKVKSVRGGGLGGCNVGSASIVINGGVVTEGVGGGGANNIATDDATGNIVGYASIVINGGEMLTVYSGGATGLARVGSVDVEINGGKIKWLTAGGSNGTTGAAKVVINGGEFEVIQSVNRGSIGSSQIIFNDGVCERMYGGGETEDKSVTGICGKSVLKLLGGTVKNLQPGTSGGIVDASITSGEYIVGVIGNEEIVNELNLVRTYSLEETIMRLISIEQTVAITDIGY